MEADRQHARVVPEDRLDAVAVVDVDVDVRHPLRALVEEVLDADRDVVVDAEAGGLVAHRVVQAPGDVRRVEALAAPHLAGGLDGRADHVRGGDLHALEDGVVVGAQPALLVDRPGRGTHPVHGVDQPPVVHGRDQVVLGHRGVHQLQAAIEDTELAGQPHREVDADGDIGCPNSEVVLREAGVEDDRRRSGAVWHVTHATRVTSDPRAWAAPPRPRQGPPLGCATSIRSPRIRRRPGPGRQHPGRGERPVLAREAEPMSRRSLFLVLGVVLLALVATLLLRVPQVRILFAEERPSAVAGEEAPAIDGRHTVRIAVAGDTGTGDEAQRATVRRIVEDGRGDPHDALLLLGDLIYDDGDADLTDELVTTRSRR